MEEYFLSRIAIISHGPLSHWNGKKPEPFWKELNIRLDLKPGGTFLLLFAMIAPRKGKNA